MTSFAYLALFLVPVACAQKLVMIIADGLSGTHFHRFSFLSVLHFFGEEGVWSTQLLPVFPTLPLPNRHTLLTGVLPRRHGIVGEYMLNWRSKQKFLNFTAESDFQQSDWWTIDPIYVTATKAKASVAMFFFPECKIKWSPSPHLCVPPERDGLSFADEKGTKMVVDATKTHDLVLVYHPNIREQIAAIGPRKANARYATEVVKFQKALERLTAQARQRIDLNVMVISPHGLVDVPKQNIRVLDDYLPMELLQTSVGNGAIKQLIAMPGKTHQVYSQLRSHTPIPNVEVYYTAPKVGDLPARYQYRKSSTVADLVLVAQPGYAIVTRDTTKQVPEHATDEVKAGMSGYDNHYPDMRGVFLAFGPVFRKGYHKGPLELCDIYALMCFILRLEGCHSSCGRILRIEDILTSEARVAVRSQLHRSSQASCAEAPSLIALILVAVISKINIY
ncbi:hypothetical protein V3C99_008390 [Haemonchus contortus]